MSIDLLYKIAISKIHGVGPVTAKKVIAYVGSVEGVFKEPKSKLQKIPGVGEHLAKQISESSVLKSAEEELRFVEKYKIEPLFYTDDSYPERLNFCEDSPLCLYKRGDLSLKNQSAISIIGTRNATEYGKGFCEKLIVGLKEQGYLPLIVSGLAYGIDVCAHKAALQYNLPTIAVLAHGFSTLYPAAHRNIAEEITKQGALLTEFTSDVKAFRNNFISRNRIVAGISEATIVIESAKKGGALVTAEMANGYSRDVFALPGKVSDKYSQGCNDLIQANKAQLLSSASDIIEALNWDISTKQPVQKRLFVELTEEESILMKELQGNEVTIDELVKETGLSMSRTSSLLLQLEFQGLIKSLPGKKYRVI